MSDTLKPQNRSHQLRVDEKNVKHLKYRIAELNIEIECLYCNAFYVFDQYCSWFNTPDIKITISQSNVEEELLNHPEIKSPDIFVDNKNVAVTYDYGCLEPYVALKQLANDVINFNTSLMHGSVVAKDGYAYMFSAPSGVGKTTRTRLWLDLYPDSIVVNGDKPLIKVTSSEILACGTPWCGKEGWNTNTMVPLRAIFLLERAEEGEESTCEEVSLGKAFPFLLQQTHRPENPDLMRKTLQLLKSLDGKVKIYKFRSTPTAESVRLAYETARPTLVPRTVTRILQFN